MSNLKLKNWLGVYLRSHTGRRIAEDNILNRFIKGGEFQHFSRDACIRLAARAGLAIGMEMGLKRLTLSPPGPASIKTAKVIRSFFRSKTPLKDGCHKVQCGPMEFGL